MASQRDIFTTQYTSSVSPTINVDAASVFGRGSMVSVVYCRKLQGSVASCVCSARSSSSTGAARAGQHSALNHRLPFRVFRRLPMVPQLFVEFLPALFGEENSGALEFDAASGAGDVIGQPMRPFHVEIDVVGAPGDQRRSPQCFQLVFDRRACACCRRRRGSVGDRACAARF